MHHPALSETNGDYDGRWLFVNEMNGRVARIDLRDFKTKQIFGPVPNVSGNHGSAFVTPNTEYSVMASRFSIPIPKGTAVEVAKYATDYKGVITGIKIDPKSGEMSFGWQVLMPPFDYDLGDAGKKVSDGWVFFTSYNTERATGKLEVTSTQRDRDYIAMVDWKMAEKAGRRGQGHAHRRREGAQPEGASRPRLLPPVRQVAARRRRGARRQLDRRLRQAPGRDDGLQLREDPDRHPEQGLHRRRGRHPGPEVRVGQGRRGPGRPRPAAHAVRADGYAYTSLFVDSAIAKWKLGTWEVVDKIPMSYSIGHLTAAEGDTVSPDGKYLVGLNKLSHGRHLSVGPSQPESSQLVDISDEKMKLLYDAFTEPEPHYAQMIKADKLKPIEVYPKEENKHPLRHLGRQGRRRDPQRQQGPRQDGRRPLHVHADGLRGQGGRRGDRRHHEHRADDGRTPRLRASSTTTSTSSSTPARRRP